MNVLIIVPILILLNIDMKKMENAIQIVQMDIIMTIIIFLNANVS